MKTTFSMLLLAMMIGGCTFYPGGLPPELYPAPVVYYSNPPFYPGYQYQYWYTQPAYPEYIFFFGNDGRHHRHERGGGHRRR